MEIRRFKIAHTDNFVPYERLDRLQLVKFGVTVIAQHVQWCPTRNPAILDSLAHSLGVTARDAGLTVIEGTNQHIVEEPAVLAALENVAEEVLPIFVNVFGVVEAEKLAHSQEVKPFRSREIPRQVDSVCRQRNLSAR